ncbi:MAG: hypothetical protein IMY76_05135 [Chloroflexi bacterium]|nr:hypothetical protein [Chloroflexota bacterium]
MSKLWANLRYCVRFTLLALAVVILVQRSDMKPGGLPERVGAFTREFEFHHESWMMNALQVKAGQVGLGAADYLSDEQQHTIVLDTINLVATVQQRTWELEQIFTDPNIVNPEEQSTALRAELNHLYEQHARIAPLAESILQNQVNATVSALGLSFGGQLIPPVLFHSTPLPFNLVVSPRNVIQKEVGISLATDMTIDQQSALEEQIDQALDVSSLVVPIGGLGTYPTMVAQSSHLPWLIGAIAHEWTHNYLSLRPLGASYSVSPELRIINETTASLAEKEIADVLMARFYPELVPDQVLDTEDDTVVSDLDDEPPPFDFRAEMHETRLKVDRMLAEGQIEKAESYMEERRQFFWDNGYAIRKLNQAYFAFYGQYADEEGGARGAAGSDEDYIGSVIRTMRTQSQTLAHFLNRLSWMWSFDQVENSVISNP